MLKNYYHVGYIYLRIKETFSRNYCCGAKAITTTYFECVFVALVTERAKCMRRVALSCFLSGCTTFFTLSHKRRDFRAKVAEHKMCVLSFSTTLCETFFILRRIQPYTVISVHKFSYKVPVILVIF